MARRSLITSLPLWLAAVAVVAVLGGCGGGGGDSSSTVASGDEGTGATTKGEAGGSTGKSGNSGGSSGKASTPSGELSKAEFVKQANAICEKGRAKGLAKMQTYVKQHGGNSGRPSSAQLTKALNAVFLPEIQTQAEEIRALGAPAGDEAKVDAFLTALEKGAEGTVDSVTGLTEGMKRSGELANEYGLSACVYG